jgi:hypothetical protein
MLASVCLLLLMIAAPVPRPPAWQMQEEFRKADWYVPPAEEVAQLRGFSITWYNDSTRKTKLTRPESSTYCDDPACPRCRERVYVIPDK